MKTRICTLATVVAFIPPLVVGAVGLDDLLAPATANPDDIMLRKPTAKAITGKTDAAQKAAAEKAAARKAAEEKVAAEKAAAEKARAEKTEAERQAAARAREEAVRKAEAKAQAERAAAEKAAAEKAAAEAEMKRLRDRVAAEKAAREKAERRADYLANPDPDERPAPKKKLVATGGGADVTEASSAAAVAKKTAKKKEPTGRAAVITADRTDYDRKEGVILFDRNVYVDDEQYQMHADRLFVFLDGTNDMRRLVALGNVSITNEDKSAWCAKAVYTKAASRIVMYGDERKPAWLRDAGDKPGDASEVRGLRITYWIDSGLATVERPVITVPGLRGANNPKDLFGVGGSKKKSETDE